MALIQRELVYQDGSPNGNKIRMEIRKESNNQRLDTLEFNTTPSEISDDFIYKSIKDKSYFSPKVKYSIVVHSDVFISTDAYVNDVSPNFQEFLLKIENAEKFSNLISFLNANRTNNKVSAVNINGYESYVNNFDIWSNDEISIKTDTSFLNRDVGIGNDVDIYTTDSTTTRVYSFFPIEQAPTVEILTGVRKDWNDGIYDNVSNDLVPYNSAISVVKSTNQPSIFKYYDRSINIDFSKFENHVKYGSARSKVVNFTKKIEKIASLGTLLDITDWTLSDTVFSIFGDTWINKLEEYGNRRNNYNTVDNLVKIFNAMTPFERWLFTEKYTKDGYQSYIANLLIEADEFDIQNQFFIMYLVPDQLVINDTNSLMSILLLIMGEFFDNIYFSIKTLENIKNYDLSSITFVDNKTVADVLNKYGITNVFSVDGISGYDSSTTSIQDVRQATHEISLRLLDNLPFILKSKGTKNAIQYLLNIYGISRDVVSVTTNGQTLSESTLKKTTFVVKDGYLISDTTPISLNIHSSSVSLNNMTTELILSGIETNTSGSLLKMGTLSNLEYVCTDSNVVFSLNYDGASHQITQSVLTPQNDWFYVGINKTNTTGSLYVSQNKYGYNDSVVTSTSSFSYTSNNPSFKTVELLSGSNLKVTEFRVFNSALDNEEFKAHADDYRSVAEKNNEKTLLVRYDFSKPIGVLGSVNNQAYIATPKPSEGLVRYYTFDDISSIAGVRRDYSGEGADITQTTGTVTGSVGKNGRGIYVETNTTYPVQFPNLTPQIELNTPFTFAGWFNIPSYPVVGNSGLISAGSTDNSYGIQLTNTGVLQSILRTETNTTTVSITSSLATNTWFHVMMSYDPTLSSNHIKTFYNGILVGMGNKPSGTTLNAVDTENVSLFSKTSLSGNSATNVSGSADNIRVYNRAVASAEEATLIMNADTFPSDNFKYTYFTYLDYYNSISIKDFPSDNIAIRNNPYVENTILSRKPIQSPKQLKKRNSLITVGISPSDYTNRYIVRNIGSFVELVPNDYNQLNYSFDVLESNKNILDDYFVEQNSMKTYKKLVRSINTNILSKFKEVSPASSTLNSGLIIRNNILNKNKTKDGKFTTSIQNGVTTPIESVVKTPVSTVKKVKSVVKTDVGTIQRATPSRKNASPIVSNIGTIILGNKSNYLSKQVTFKEKKMNTVYLSNMGKSIETKQGLSPWAKNLFRGYQIIQGIGEQVETIDNAGAIIIVT